MRSLLGHRRSLFWLGCLALTAWQPRLFAVLTRGPGVEHQDVTPSSRLTPRITVETAPALLAILDDELDRLSGSNLAALLRRLAKFQQKRLDSSLIAKLREILPKATKAVQKSTMSPRELCTCFWASAHLADVAPEALNLAKVAGKKIPGKVSSLQHQGLSQCFWAAAHLQSTSKKGEQPLQKVLRKVAAAVAKTLPVRAAELKPQEVSNCLWVLPALADRLPEKVHGMTPQHLSNCLWATAQLRNHESALKNVEPLAKAIRSETKRLKPQELATCLCASAHLKDVAPEVLQLVPAVAYSAEECDLKPRELSNCLWASAHLVHEAPSVLSMAGALAQRIPESAPRMTSQEVSNYLLAVALHDGEDSGLTKIGDQTLLAGVERLKQLLLKLTKQQLFIHAPTVLWACARAGHRDVDLLTRLAKKYQNLAKRLPTWCLGRPMHVYSWIDTTKYKHK
ncbi:Atp13a1 [Symbiodinium sp. CCMP2592]|nr:Atp13a1 [Symbiodinium sp. CCMP2592]